MVGYYEMLHNQSKNTKLILHVLSIWPLSFLVAVYVFPLLKQDIHKRNCFIENPSTVIEHGSCFRKWPFISFSINASLTKCTTLQKREHIRLSCHSVCCLVIDWLVSLLIVCKLCGVARDGLGMALVCSLLGVQSDSQFQIHLLSVGGVDTLGWCGS